MVTNMSNKNNNNYTKLKLKPILNEWGVRIWTGISWNRIGSSGGLL
jgi:hypothetical protein